MDKMNGARYRHTVAVLANGKVLVTGGRNGSYALNTAELCDPETEIWITTSSVNHERYVHTASMVASGEVLVTGGWNASYALNSVELYDASARN
ncbi:unnamed protein product [Rotaria socialis]|nr:unnamed protein product [Rotaria socialis]